MPLRNAVFLAGFVAYIVIRGVYEGRAKAHPKASSRAGAVEYALMALVFTGCLLLPALHLATPWLAFADYDLPEVTVPAGAAVMILALWLFYRSHADLGSNWSVTLEIRERHELVTRGVYGRIRHPMYAAIWLFSLAQALLLENRLAGWSALAAFGVMYFVRVPREERMMSDAFGPAWQAYAARTGRLFPRRLARDAA